VTIFLAICLRFFGVAGIRTTVVCILYDSRTNSYDRRKSLSASLGVVIILQNIIVLAIFSTFQIIRSTTCCKEKVKVKSRLGGEKLACKNHACKNILRVCMTDACTRYGSRTSAVRQPYECVRVVQKLFEFVRLPNEFVKPWFHQPCDKYFLANSYDLKRKPIAGKSHCRNTISSDRTAAVRCSYDRRTTVVRALRNRRLT